MLGRFDKRVTDAEMSYKFADQTIPNSQMAYRFATMISLLPAAIFLLSCTGLSSTGVIARHWKDLVIECPSRRIGQAFGRPQRICGVCVTTRCSNGVGTA